MNVEQNTGNAEKLPLHERAARGLLLPKPELSLAEILALEHPTDLAARNALGAALRAAIDYGDLVARKDKTPPRTVRRSSAYWPADSWSLGNGDPPDRLVTYPGTVTEFIDREDYRAWRNACPAELLLPPPLSKIQKWLGATPTAESIAPVETSLPERRQRQDALNHAIRAAIAVLSPSGGTLPQPRALFDYLRTADQTKTVIDSSKEQLTWYSAETGRKQTATIANLKKRLDRWID